LEIPEVWFWQDDQLRLYGWDGEDYVVLAASRLLEGLEIERLEAGVKSGRLLEAVKLFGAGQSLE
jgi:hypothetical protein